MTCSATPKAYAQCDRPESAVERRAVSTANSDREADDLIGIDAGAPFVSEESNRRRPGTVTVHRGTVELRPPE